jgi:hypothetical protein
MRKDALGGDALSNCLPIPQRNAVASAQGGPRGGTSPLEHCKHAFTIFKGESESGDRPRIRPATHLVTAAGGNYLRSELAVPLQTRYGLKAPLPYNGHVLSIIVVRLEAIMKHVDLDTVDEGLKRFVLSLSTEAGGSVLEMNGRPVAWVVPAVAVPTNGEEVWTEEKNDRRCDLIERKYAGTLSPTEAVELAQLQEQMLRYRQRVAPLPLEDARRLHQELLAKASRSSADA